MACNASWQKAYMKGSQWGKEMRGKNPDLDKLLFLNASNFHFLTIKILFLLKLTRSEGREREKKRRLLNSETSNPSLILKKDGWVCAPSIGNNNWGKLEMQPVLGQPMFDNPNHSKGSITSNFSNKPFRVSL